MAPDPTDENTVKTYHQAERESVSSSNQTNNDTWSGVMGGQKERRKKGCMQQKKMV